MARLFFPLFAGGTLLSAGMIAAPGQTAAPVTVPAGQAQTPSQLYVQAILLREDGAKKEKAGEFAAAYYKYKEARGYFDSVYEADPSWNAQLVEDARKRILEQMESVRQSEIRRRAAGGAISTGGVIGVPKSPETAGPAPAPGRNTAEVVEERLRGMQARIEEITAKNEEVIKQLGGREEELRAARKELLDSKQKEQRLLGDLADAKSRVETASLSERRANQKLTKQVAQLELQLNEAMTQLQSANGRADGLLAELEKAYGEIRLRTQERDELQRERDQLNGLIAADGSGKGMDKLKIVQDNQRMRKELETAKAKINQLSADREKDQAEIASLRGQLKSVQEQLAGFQAESESYRLQIAALTTQLDETQARLAQAAQSGIPEPELAAENGVLREIILQQMKQQAKRETARRNLMDELTREGVLERMREMGAETEMMLRAVAEMAAPVTLTRDQRGVLAGGGLDSFLLKGGVGAITVAEAAEDVAAGAASGNGSPAGTAAGNTPPDPSALSPELRAYATAAEEQFRNGSFGEAENQYRKILIVHPQSVHALKNLAVVQLRLGTFEEAEVNLKKAQAYHYDDPMSHYLLGVAYLRQGREDEAVEEIQEGLKLNPDNARAHVTLGMVALRKKQQKNAEREFKQAINIDPTSADAHYNLAVIYATSEKMDLFRQHYRLAVRHGAARNGDMDKLLGG